MRFACSPVALEVNNAGPDARITFVNTRDVVLWLVGHTKEMEQTAKAMRHSIGIVTAQMAGFVIPADLASVSPT